MQSYGNWEAALNTEYVKKEHPSLVPVIKELDEALNSLKEANMAEEVVEMVDSPQNFDLSEEDSLNIETVERCLGVLEKELGYSLGLYAIPSNAEGADDTDFVGICANTNFLPKLFSITTWTVEG